MTDSPDDYPDRYTEPPEDAPAALGDYRLRDEEHAWWASEWHTYITKRRLEIATAAAARIDRIRKGAEDADAPLKARQAWFAAMLEDYARRVRARDPRQTKVITPYGVIGTRTKPQSFHVDLEAALAWADRTPRTARLIHETTTRRVLKSEVVRTLTVKDGKVFDTFTGEEITWATPIPEDLDVWIKPAGLT